MVYPSSLELASSYHNRIKSIVSFKNIFILILFLGILLRIVIAFLFENILWPDEIFQSLEQAHRIVFGVGLIPWEFREGIRSYVFPGFLSLFLFPFRFFQIPSSLYYTAFIRIVLCFFSGSLIFFSYKYGKELGVRYAGIFAAFFSAFWYEFIYFAPKAFDSVAAAYLILPGLFFAEKALRNKSNKYAAAAGLLLSLGVVFRIHYAILWMIPVLICVFYGFDLRKLKIFFPYLFSSLLIFSFSGILDWVTWGKPFHSLISNIYANLIEGVSKGWGTMPFFWYVNVLWDNMGLILPLSIMLGFIPFQRTKLIGVSILAVFLLHSFVPHKEYRFIYVVLPLLFVILAVGIDYLINKISHRYLRITAVLAVIVLFLWSSYYFASDYTFKRIGYNFSSAGSGTIPAWNAFQDNLMAYRYLSTRQDIWGLQDNVSSWWWSGGHYYLHHDIPIYYITKLSMEDILNNKYANYLITRSFLFRKELEYVDNIKGIYVYKKTFLKEREIDPNYTINR